MKLVSFGNKTIGSEAKQRAEEYLFRRLKEISAEARVLPFTFEGWEVGGDFRLAIEKPMQKELEAWVFMGSGGGRASGRLVRMGYNYVWNMYGWERYAIMSQGKICGYLSGRQEGGALSQTLVEGCSELPHFIVSAEDNRLLRELILSGQEVLIEAEASCRRVENMRGANLLLPIRGRKGGRRVLVCGHYDTMYNTPGAYDNQAGAAVLLKLAEQLVAERLDRDVDLLLTDGEEWNLAGSRHFAETEDLSQYEYVLNVDGIGRGDELEIWSGKESFERRLAEQLMDYEEIPWKTFKNPPPPGSDHTPFYERGVPCCMYTFNDQGIIHTPGDVYDERKLANMEKMLHLVLYTLKKI